MRSHVFFAVAALICAGCTCKQTVNGVAPSLTVSPVGIDFGQVKVNDRAHTTLTLMSVSKAQVTVSKLALATPDSHFELGAAPGVIAPFASATVELTFSPTEVGVLTNTLLVTSDDPEHSVIRVAVVGEGAMPTLTVTPGCDRSRGCTGSVTVSPPAIEFGSEPTHRAMPLETIKLPTVAVNNDGTVALKVTKFAIEGPDAAAFSFADGATFPAEGKSFDKQTGFSASLRFVPTSEGQDSYQASLVIEADDPMHPKVTVSLHGTLRPNLAPVVCGNLVRVVPPLPGDLPRDYSGAAQWAQVKMPGDAGVDFSTTRDVRPGDLTVFSAISDSTDVSSCTSDPEDSRTGLTYSWVLTKAPTGALTLPIAGASSAQAQLRPVVTGKYQLRLTVTDAQARASSVELAFSVAIKQDLVAQLQWLGFANVDLDLHLVRPSPSTDPFAAAFSFFDQGTANKTSSDINGFAVNTLKSHAGAGYDFDWGEPGSSDDPTLNVDDTGSGALLENVSLNFPEHDPACATASCTYRVLVHSFKDGRVQAPVGCFVDGGAGCHDGEACGCAADARCVADGAPIGDAGLGAGKCLVAPKPVVQLFFRGSAVPAATIPLDTLTPPDALVIGAPCQLLAVADIAWPAKSAIGSLADGGTPAPVVTVRGADLTGRVIAPELARFGYRQPGGNLQCSPDLSLGGIDWYARQP